MQLQSSENALKNLCDTPLKINFKKYDDILFMLKYVPTIYHDYLTELSHESTTRETNEIDDVYLNIDIAVTLYLGYMN